MKYLFFIMLCVITLDLAAVLDLDTMHQSFVLETKRLHINGYPDAFNPSLVRYNNKYLLSFRARHPGTGKATLVGFVWLNKNFKPVGEVKLLNTYQMTSNAYIQDPRLFTLKDKLYMAFSDLIEDPIQQVLKRTMCMAEIIIDENDNFTAIHQDSFHEFDGNINNKFEKNWVPFNYQDIMLLAYSISPHKIFLPVLGENRCVTIAENTNFFNWNWGELRGGTPALLIDDRHYLSFFHSSIPMATKQSQSQSMPHYFMGAYLFESQPPFAIKKISPQPILNKDFYNGEAHQTWKPLKAIFPAGIVVDKKFIWVSYGRQDFESWIVKIDKECLLKSLISVESNL